MSADETNSMEDSLEGPDLYNPEDVVMILNDRIIDSLEAIPHAQSDHSLMLLEFRSIGFMASIWWLGDLLWSSEGGIPEGLLEIEPDITLMEYISLEMNRVQELVSMVVADLDDGDEDMPPPATGNPDPSDPNVV